MGFIRFFKISILLLFSAQIDLSAQQLPVFSNYIHQPLFVSPATAGLDSTTSISVLHRTQWVGQEIDNTLLDRSAGQFQLITASMKLPKRSGGIGATIYRDVVGPIQTIDARLSYAYHLPYNKLGTVSVGFAGGLRSKRVDFDQFIVKHSNDVLLGEGNQSETEGDLSIGVWIQHQKYYIGGSYNQFLEQDFDGVFIPDNTTIILTGGYHFQTNLNWKISPSFLFVNEDSENTFTVHTLGEFIDVLEVGIAYRYEEATSILLGTWLLPNRSLKLNFAADLITSNRDAKSTASFEVMVGYRFL